MGEFENKPLICFHRRSKTSTIRDHSEAEQQILSSCVGRKRMMIRETKTVLLPDDIIHTKILTLLPPKYIMRFRLVCKSWNSLFSTSDFLNSHQKNHPEDEEDLLIVKKRTSTKDFGICIVSRTNYISIPSVCGTLLGSINGLICMSSRRGKKICLWNPAIAQLKIIFTPPPHDHHCLHTLVGFCWDHVQNDYKVMLLCIKSSASTRVKLCIYSSNSATWTIAIPDRSTLPVGYYKTPPSTIVKGIPYWSYLQHLTLPNKRRRKREVISTFKFVPEISEFRFLADLDTHGKSIDIVNIKDCLVGMAYKMNSEDTLVDIYSLNDEESRSGVWSKMYTIGPVYNSFRVRQLSQGFKNGGEILIVGKAGPFSFYDPKTKQTKVLESSDCDSFRICFRYTPSLIRVQGMKSMQEFSSKDGVNNYCFKDLDSLCYFFDE